MCSCSEHSRGCPLVSVVERALKNVDLTDFLAVFKGEIKQEHTKHRDVMQQVTFSKRSVSVLEHV